MTPVLLLTLVGVVGGSSSTYNSLYQQIPAIQTVQNQVNDVDQNYLNPVAASNENLLTDIHNASLMLANQSAIDTEVASDQAGIVSQKIDINNNSVPAMKEGLNASLDALLGQQNNNRYYAMVTAHGVWQSIENTTLVNFVNDVYNNTATAITNLSNYIMPIYAFDNVTTGENNESFANLSARLRRVLPREVRQLQGIWNNQSYINQTSSELQTVIEPAGEAAVRAGIETILNSSFSQFAIANAANEEFQETQLTKNMNVTARGYNALFNNTVNNLTNAVGNNVNTYLKAVSSMQNLAVSTQGQASRIAALYALATQSTSVLQSRHDILLGTITPVVSGIGAKISSLLLQLRASIDASNALLNSTVLNLNHQLNVTQSGLVDTFSQSVSKDYDSDYQEASVNLQSLRDAIDLRLQQLNSTVELMLNGLSSTSMVSSSNPGQNSNSGLSTEQAVVEANQTLDSAIQVVNAMKLAVFNAIQTQFSQFLSSTNIKLMNLNNTFASDMQVYESGRQQLLSSLASAEKSFRSTANSLIENLLANRGEQFSAFNQTVQPYPSVGASSVTQPISYRSGNLSELENRISSFESSLSAIASGLVPKFTSVENVFNAFNESEYSLDLTNARTEALSAAEHNMSNLVEVAVKTFNTSSNQSLNAQVKEATDLIKSNMHAFTSSRISPWQPAVETEAVLEQANSLLGKVQTNLANVQESVSQIVRKFSSDASAQDAAVNEFINLGIADMQKSWSEQIAAKVSFLGGRNSMNEILGNISAQLEFSDDAGQYKSAVQSIQDNLERISNDLSQASIQIDMSFQSALQSSQANLAQIESALNTVMISSSQKIVPNLIIAFKNESQTSLDAAVNTTRDSIWNSISNTYSATVGSFHDYLNYVNGSMTNVRAATVSASSGVSSSALELRNVSKFTDSMFQDGAQLAATEKNKSVTIHQQLLDLADLLMSSADQANDASRSAMKNLLLREKINRKMILKNFSADFNQDFVKNISKLSSSLHASNQLFNQTIATHGGIAKARLEQVQARYEEQINNESSALNSSPIFELLTASNSVSDSLNAKARETHQLIRPVLHALNKTVSRIIPSSEPLKDLVKKYSAAAQHVANLFPSLIHAEIDKEDSTVREEGGVLEKILADRPVSDVVEPQNVFEKLRKVQILQDLVDDARNKVKRATLRVPKPKDYTSEVNAIREKLDHLQKNHETFIHEQQARVQRWLSRKHGK